MTAATLLTCAAVGCHRAIAIDEEHVRIAVRDEHGQVVKGQFHAFHTGCYFGDPSLDTEEQAGGPSLPATAVPEAGAAEPVSTTHQEELL